MNIQEPLVSYLLFNWGEMKLKMDFLLAFSQVHRKVPASAIIYHLLSQFIFIYHFSTCFTLPPSNFSSFRLICNLIVLVYCLLITWNSKVPHENNKLNMSKLGNNKIFSQKISCSELLLGHSRFKLKVRGYFYYPKYYIVLNNYQVLCNNYYYVLAFILFLKKNM